MAYLASAPALGAYIGIDAPTTISAQLLRTSEVAVTRIQWAARPQPELVQIACENAFLIFMLRGSLPSNPYWIDGQPVTLEPRRKGQFNLLDLHQEHVAEVTAAVDCVSIYVSREALGVLAYEQGCSLLHAVKSVPGAAMDDPVIWHLSECFLSVLQSPNDANPLFVERVGLALGWHLICEYSDQSLNRPPLRGGLAPWQERRAREVLKASIRGRVTLNELAHACCLSRSHFARAFKKTMGIAPHQWLLAARIDMAKNLLESSQKSVDEIAGDCGFTDEGHFRRAFVRAQGLTPAVWRRERQR